jgi:hypothetical protein
MADVKFSCPHCSTSIECDELWCGHEIQCPSCQKEFVVPQKPSGPPAAGLASAKAGQPKLAISAAHAQKIAATKSVAPQVAAYEQKLKAAKAGQTGNGMKWVTAGIVVVVLAVGGYFGYGYYTKWQEKKTEAARLAAAPPPVTNAAPSEAEPPPPPKELPVIPAVWTLDVDRAKIPDGKINGTVSGTNFVVETAIASPQVIGFYEGSPRSPDRALLVYLNLKATDSLTNRSWTVAKDKRDKEVRQVVKQWKTNPRYAPHVKAFSSGYTLKLEFDQAVSNVISGKIYLALPDTEQSVLAGQFKALTAMPAASTSGAAVEAAPPTAPPMADRPPAGDRYGRTRRGGAPAP